MDIAYTEEKKFTMEQVQKLFRSVGWVSGEYPQRLYKALMHSSRVTTAWDGARLVGLARWMTERCSPAFIMSSFIRIISGAESPEP